MPSFNPSNSNLKTVVTVSQMSSMLGLSRARFYELVERGVFLAPVYCITTHRPLYLREMQIRNLEVRREQIGINGQYVLFYEPRNNARSTSRSRNPRRSNALYGSLINDLIPQLQSLGLGNVKAQDVSHILSTCYPNGVGEVGEDDVLRTVYRHLRSQD